MRGHPFDLSLWHVGGINALGWLRPAVVSTRLAVSPCDGVERRRANLLGELLGCSTGGRSGLDRATVHVLVLGFGRGFDFFRVGGTKSMVSVAPAFQGIVFLVRKRAYSGRTCCMASSCDHSAGLNLDTMA